MRRALFLILAVFVTCVATFGQGASSESQTLQALLTEVRELRQELQVLFTRAQSAQLLLLSRLQIQQVAVTRASQHVDESRSKLVEVQVVQKSEADEVKRLQGVVSANPEQQNQLEQTFSRAQSDLDVTTDLVHQRQATETEAEQQLQTEEDKLKKLEAQLDDLLKETTGPSEQSGRVPR
jgi:chromosome segregation ATPase